MRKKPYILPLLLCIGFLLAGCRCEHEWVEADCVTARTCSLCQETEGEPLGHSWKEADCTTAKTCSACGEAEGDPLGHTPGEWTQTLDIISCELLREQHCAVCADLLTSETVPATTFTAEEMFVFSPREFLERMKAVAAPYYPDFSYSFMEQNGGLMANVYLTGSAYPDGIVSFFKDGSVYVAASGEDSAGLWCVSYSGYGTVADFGSILGAEVLKMVYMTCDPLLTEEDYMDFVVTKIASAANAAQSGTPFGYMEKNGLLYEFGHIVYDGLVVENIQVYPADWRQ